MPNLSARRLAACLALLAGLAQAATGAEIPIVDAKSQPESLTLAPGGAGTFFFGLLADPATGALGECQLTPAPDSKPVQRHTAPRGFHLSTGAHKLRWNPPGDNSTCNDFSIGRDKALHITDTANGGIYKLPSGASTAELFLDHRALDGIDGITFLDGTLYGNNVGSSKIDRTPVDASGKAKQPVEILLDQSVKGPDGMPAANGKLLLAENSPGKISVIAVDGDQTTVKVIKEGLKTPTAVDIIRVAKRGAGKALSIPLPK
jgi:hypothetical protein